MASSSETKSFYEFHIGIVGGSSLLSIPVLLKNNKISTKKILLANSCNAVHSFVSFHSSFRFVALEIKYYYMKMLNTKHCTRSYLSCITNIFFYLCLPIAFTAKKSLTFTVIQYTGWEYPVQFECQCQRMFGTKNIERPRMMENGKVEFAFLFIFQVCV